MDAGGYLDAGGYSLGRSRRADGLHLPFGKPANRKGPELRRWIRFVDKQDIRNAFRRRQGDLFDRAPALRQEQAFGAATLRRSK